MLKAHPFLYYMQKPSLACHCSRYIVKPLRIIQFYICVHGSQHTLNSFHGRPTNTGVIVSCASLSVSLLDASVTAIIGLKKEWRKRLAPAVPTSTEGGANKTCCPNHDTPMQTKRDQSFGSVRLSPKPGPVFVYILRITTERPNQYYEKHVSPTSNR